MVNGFRSLLCIESLTIPVLTFAFVKLIIPPQKDSTQLWQLQMHLLRMLLTLIGIPLAWIVILLFACYFEIVKFLAKLRFGPAYYDVFAGADSTWTGNSPECKAILQVMYLFENLPDTPEKMMRLFTEPHFQAKILKNHPRLSCLRKYFLGYSYYVRIEFDYSKVVRYFDDYNTLEEFHAVINRATQSGLPYNDEFMWEVLIGRKPVQLEAGKWQIPLVTRYHHSTTDGIALSMFMLTTYSKNGMARFRAECERYNQCFAIDKSKNSTKDTFDLAKFLNKLKSVLSKDVYLNFDMIRHKEPENILHRKLSGEKVVCFSLEQPGEDLLGKIKKTKRALNVAFADVLLSAISAAFAEYYRKFDSKPPTKIYSGNPYLLKTAELHKIVRVNKEGEPVTDLGNKFTIGIIELATDVKLLENPRKIIEKLHETTQKLKNSMDFSLVYWLFNIFATVVPKPIAMLVGGYFDYTAIITNVPGVMSLSYRNDCKVENMFVWTNNFNRGGVTITLFTYDNLLRATVHVDRKLIDDVKDVQILCDDILRYIHVLHDDTFALQGNK